MNTDDLWQVFSMSGKVEDYLSFKNSVENKEKRDADKHKGNNSERTEYRRKGQARDGSYKGTGAY